MDFYLASKYSNLCEVAGYAQRLQAAGHTVTSHWLHGKHQGHRPSELRKYAIEDLEAVRYCDTLVLFELPLKNKMPSTGRAVEFGYALALKKKLIIVGPRSSVFHYVTDVEHFDTPEEFLEMYT